MRLASPVPRERQLPSAEMLRRAFPTSTWRMQPLVGDLHRLAPSLRNEVQLVSDTGD
jgi:hypothetical protein